MSSSDDIAKMLGALSQHDEESTVKTYVDTGYPELNHALSSDWDKGLPVGRIVEIYGPESSGKTAVSSAAMISAQRQGGFAGFHDHERSFQQYLSVAQGLDPHPGRFSYRKPKTFEESIGLAVQTAVVLRDKKLIAPEAPIVWVFDSLASMVPNSAYYDLKTGKEKDPASRNMNDNTALARATSNHFPAFAQHCDDLGMLAIFLNQVRATMNAYGPPETTPGGKAPKFYFSQRIALKAAKITKGEGESAEVIGSQITAKVIKNKVTRPFQTATWRFDFDEDGMGRFNVHRSLIDFLSKEKILTKSGNYIVWEGKNRYPAALAELLQKESDGLDKLKALLPAGYAPPVIVEVDGDVSTIADGDLAA